MNQNDDPRLESFWFNYQIIAANNTIDKNYEWLWRNLTREYSERFSTPLAQVRALPLQEVLLEVLESRYEELEDEALMELVRNMVVDKDKAENDLKERMRRYEEEEKLKREKRKAIKAPPKMEEKTYSIENEDD
jgi:hypothetical protein